MNNKAGRPVGTIKGKHPTSISGKRTRLYLKWAGMHARCYQPSHHSYEHYHSKGIAVCDRWHGRDGYDNFCDDMGECPEGWTLDRIDGTKGYAPENCRWATWQTQADNRVKNGPVANPDSLRQKAMRAGLPYIRVYQRVHLGGWSEEEALSTPVADRKKWMPGQIYPYTIPHVPYA